MINFGTYLDSLVGSWKALAAPHHDARVIVEPGFAASVFDSYPVLCNAVLLDAADLERVGRLYSGHFAVWSHQASVAARIETADYVRAEVTYPMVCELAAAELHPSPDVERVDPEVVATVSGTPASLLQGVADLRAYATRDHTSVAALIEVGDDVYLSFVATKPDARRRGFSAAVVTTALSEARDDGFLTSSLQSTPVARSGYARLGYVGVGVWQEWVRAR